jgi:hypothetical protein
MRIFIALTACLVFGWIISREFPRIREDGCPAGWEEADWETDPQGVKQGYWYCKVGR